MQRSGWMALSKNGMENSIYIFYLYYMLMHKEAVAKIYLCYFVGNTYKNQQIKAENKILSVFHKFITM